jgi:hypothetical protein
MTAYEGEGSNNEMAADLLNPQCFVVSGGSGKLAYCDLRVGKRVKQLMGLDSSLRCDIHLLLCAESLAARSASLAVPPGPASWL